MNITAPRQVCASKCSESRDRFSNLSHAQETTVALLSSLPPLQSDPMENVLSDDEFDIVSNPGQRSVESSIADLDHVPKQEVHEPEPTQAALDQFDTARFTAADIQAYVRKSLDSGIGGNVAYPLEQRTVRVYVDGIFDMFNTA